MNLFLEVKFHDNDFSGNVYSALRRLWRFVYDNNHHLLNGMNGNNSTIPELFELLDAQGILKESICRLIDSEYAASGVEFNTRGLYRKTYTPLTTYGPLVNISSRLGIDVVLHKDNRFSKRWNNSESASLHLKTGRVDIF